MIIIALGQRFLMSLLHQVDDTFLIKCINSSFQASTTKSSKKVPLFFYTLYIEGEGGTTAGEGEAIVRVHVTDANDNRPEFEVEGGELVAAVPTTAEYGHLVTKVQVCFLSNV